MNEKRNRSRRPRRGGLDEIPILADLAARCLKYGAPEKARTLYTLLVAQRPRVARYRAALGAACLRAGRTEEAVTHLEKVFKGKERDMVGWEVMLMERALRANGMAQEAAAVVRRFLKERGLK